MVYVVSLTFGIICWVIINCIIAPYTCYWVYQLWIRRNSLIIRKRKPGLLAASECVFWLWVLLTSTHHWISLEFEEEIQLIRVLSTFSDFILAPILFSVFGLSSARFWLLFFMINHNDAMTKNQWKSVIHSKKAAKNWFINNKQRYGTWKNIRKWVIVYITVQYIVVIILRINVIVNYRNYSEFPEDELHYSESLRNFVRIIMFLCLQIVIPLSVLLIMRCKTPLYSDEIGIRKEFDANLTAALAIIKSIFYTELVFQISASIVDWHHKRWGKEDPGEVGTYGTLFAMCLYGAEVVIAAIFSFMSLRSTKWPLQQFESIINGFPAKSPVIASSVPLNSMTADEQVEKPKIVQINESVKKSVKEQMDETFLNRDLMDAFMEHLFAEYCAECLLSVIEFSQFKKLIKKENKKNEDISEESKHAFDFCKSVPQSEIVYGSKSSDYRHIATELYRKYIAVSAEWEININSATRNQYSSLFEKGGIEKNDESNDAKFYYTLFDPCIDVMITLITPAFSRFKRTQKYKMIQQNIIQ